MKKMYKKPITETTPMEPAFTICGLSDGGNISDKGTGLEGDAPKRRTEVF